METKTQKTDGRNAAVPERKTAGKQAEKRDREKAGADRMGKVWLAGAGPGDEGLLTVKAAALIQQADVIVYDALVSVEILSRIPQDKEVIYVGKHAGNHPVPQEEINQILVREAKKGKQVLRLKGGDPFVFGRGGEELETLAAEGIPFEEVPGITSSVAVPAYAGIPVTHRDYTSSFHVITGHARKDGKLNIDFPSLVRLKGTLAFLMSLSSLEMILDGLLAAGLDSDTPAALLERGTTARQRRIVATAATLKEAVGQADICTPAMLLVGQVCALSDTLHWAEDRPLGGRRFLLTRPRQNMSVLAGRLRELGAQVIEMPAIRTEIISPNQLLKEALTRFASVEKQGNRKDGERQETGRWLVFTSPIGVTVFFQALRELKLDLRFLLGGRKAPRLAAIGSATAAALEERGLMPDLVPKTYCAAELGREIEEASEPGEQVLILRAEKGSDDLIPPLVRGALSVEDIPLYRTEYALRPLLQDQVRRMLEAGEIDAAVFTSASTVYGFVQAVELSDYSRILAVCIGEQTGRAAQKYGMQIETARQASIDALTGRILELFGKEG